MGQKVNPIAVPIDGIASPICGFVSKQRKV